MGNVPSANNNSNNNNPTAAAKSTAITASTAWHSSNQDIERLQNQKQIPSQTHSSTPLDSDLARTQNKPAANTHTPLPIHLKSQPTTATNTTSSERALPSANAAATAAQDAHAQGPLKVPTAANVAAPSSRPDSARGSAVPFDKRTLNLRGVYALEQSSPFVGSPLNSTEYIGENSLFTDSRRHNNRDHLHHHHYHGVHQPPPLHLPHDPYRPTAAENAVIGGYAATSLLSSALDKIALASASDTFNPSVVQHTYDSIYPVANPNADRTSTIAAPSPPPPRTYPADAPNFDSESNSSEDSDTPAGSVGDRWRGARPMNLLPPPRRSLLRRAISTSDVQLEGETFDIDYVASNAVPHSTVISAEVNKKDAAHLELRSGPIKSYKNSSRIVHGFGAHGNDVSPMKRLDQSQDPSTVVTIPTIVTWPHGGDSVYVTGTFNDWKHKIKLSRSTTDFATVLDLPPGVHSLKFVVDGEWKCSDDMEVVGDAEGNQVNSVTVTAAGIDDEENGDDADGEGMNDGRDLVEGEILWYSRQLLSTSLHPLGSSWRRPIEIGACPSAASSPPGSYTFEIPPELLPPVGSSSPLSCSANSNADEPVRPTTSLNDLDKKDGRRSVRSAAASRATPATLRRDAMTGGMDAREVGVDGEEVPGFPRHLETVLLNVPNPQLSGHRIRLQAATLFPSPNQAARQTPPPQPRHQRNQNEHQQPQQHYFAPHHTTDGRTFLEASAAANVPARATLDCDMDPSLMPVPNHVVLNHLYACSIRDGVVAVASTVRYKQKVSRRSRS